MLSNGEDCLILCLIPIYRCYSYPSRLLSCRRLHRYTLGCSLDHWIDNRLLMRSRQYSRHGSEYGDSNCLIKLCTCTCVFIIRVAFIKFWIHMYMCTLFLDLHVQCTCIMYSFHMGFFKWQSIITIEYCVYVCTCTCMYSTVNDWEWSRIHCTCILFSVSIRNRLPNHFDDLSYWSDVLLWREQHFRTIIKAYDGTSHAEQVNTCIM